MEPSRVHKWAFGRRHLGRLHWRSTRERKRLHLVPHGPRPDGKFSQ